MMAPEFQRMAAALIIATDITVTRTLILVMAATIQGIPVRPAIRVADTVAAVMAAVTKCDGGAPVAPGTVVGRDEPRL